MVSIMFTHADCHDSQPVVQLYTQCIQQLKCFLGANKFMVRDPHSLSFLATGGQVTGDYIQPQSQAVLGTKLGSHGVGRKTKSHPGFSRKGKHYKTV